MRAPVLVLAQAMNPTPSFGTRPLGSSDTAKLDLDAVTRQSGLVDPQTERLYVIVSTHTTALLCIKLCFFGGVSLSENVAESKQSTHFGLAMSRPGGQLKLTTARGVVCEVQSPVTLGNKGCR